jgi:hypothetical protein
MDVTRVAAVFPVIKIDSFKGKNTNKDNKSREDRKDKDFGKTLKSKNER